MATNKPPAKEWLSGFKEEVAGLAPEPTIETNPPMASLPPEVQALVKEQIATLDNLTVRYSERMSRFFIKEVNREDDVSMRVLILQAAILAATDFQKHASKALKDTVHALERGQGVNFSLEDYPDENKH